MLQRSEVFLYHSFHALCCIVLFKEASTCTCAKGWYSRCHHGPNRVPAEGEVWEAELLKSFLLKWCIFKAAVTYFLGNSGAAERTTPSILWLKGKNLDTDSVSGRTLLIPMKICHWMSHKLFPRCRIIQIFCETTHTNDCWLSHSLPVKALC